MTDYTDIKSKIEDVNDALDSLYNLAHGQYDNVFAGEDQANYTRLMDCIKSAKRCMDEADDLNERLSDAFETKNTEEKI